ncbi:MAG: hypothetical protein K0Q94_5040 [Paenibacillus sp.]|nr:hypothetical protein [Paenibacillus sp.]
MTGVWVLLGLLTAAIIGIFIYALNKGYSRKWDDEEEQS